MNEKSESKKISDKELDHIKYFLVLLISVLLAENLTIFLTGNIPAIFVPLTNLFGTLTSPLIAVILTISIAKLLTVMLPQLNTTSQVPWYVYTIPIIILSHPLLISITGSKLTVTWLFLDIIEFSSPILAIFEIIIYVFGGLMIALIQSQAEVKTNTKLNKYLRYIADEIFTILVVVSLMIYLVGSYILENFESLDLTKPVKILLFYLFYMATYPVTESS